MEEWAIQRSNKVFNKKQQTENTKTRCVATCGYPSNRCAREDGSLGAQACGQVVALGELRRGRLDHLAEREGTTPATGRASLFLVASIVPSSVLVNSSKARSP